MSEQKRECLSDADLNGIAKVAAVVVDDTDVARATTPTEKIDLKQELEEQRLLDDDKESVASETHAMPSTSEPALEADMQTALDENKPALSEGGYSDHGNNNEGDSPKIGDRNDDGNGGMGANGL